MQHLARLAGWFELSLCSYNFHAYLVGQEFSLIHFSVRSIVQSIVKSRVHLYLPCHRKPVWLTRWKVAHAPWIVWRHRYVDTPKKASRSLLQLQPCLHLGRHWCHSHDKSSQAFPLCFYILSDQNPHPKAGSPSNNELVVFGIVLLTPLPSVPWLTSHGSPPHPTLLPPT